MTNQSDTSGVLPLDGVSLQRSESTITSGGAYEEATGSEDPR
jgi:hypothetical protein